MADLATPTPRWTAEAIERIAREITHGWMAHLGYTPEEIAAADGERDHTLCDLTSEGWFCLDEDEQTHHPLHEVADETAELVMFVLEHPALKEANHG